MTNRTDWLLDPDVAYLNHGAFGALPRVVGEAASGLRAEMEGNPANLMARRLPGMLDDIRNQVAALLHADPAGSTFVGNATAGTATVLTALGSDLGPGDEVLTTDHRYGAVGVQLETLADRTGASIVTAHVPLDIATRADVVAALAERVTAHTKLLVIDSIASASGFVFPLAEIIPAMHDLGIPVVVDAAHAPGQLDVDLEALGADFWVGNLHKWVSSPRAAAILNVAPKWRDRVRPLVPSHHFAKGYQPAFDWTGTFDPIPILAIPAALAFWAEFGWDEMRATQRAIVDDGAARVAKALGTTAPAADDFRAAMRVIELPVTLDVERAYDVEAVLSAEHKVEVSLMSLHARSYVRVCGQVYNTPSDYDRLAAALPGLVEAE